MKYLLVRIDDKISDALVATRFAQGYSSKSELVRDLLRRALLEAPEDG